LSFRSGLREASALGFRVEVNLILEILFFSKMGTLLALGRKKGAL
jgi:hypothetical protein